MKLLVFADLHGSEIALKDLLKKSKNVDAIVCAGDISIFQERLESLLSKLNKTKKPVMIIPGNHEDERHLNNASKRFENVHVIHNKSHELENMLFLGYGGGGFSESFSIFSNQLNEYIEKASKHPNAILVTHAPPNKTKLDLLAGSHIGSKPIRKFIEKTQPKLAVCGHIHENEGLEDTIGMTKIINPGYRGKIITL